MTIKITDINSKETVYGGVASQVLTGNVYTLTIPVDGQENPTIILWNWAHVSHVVITP